MMKDAELLKLIEISPKEARAVIVEEYSAFVYAVVYSRLKGCVGLDEIRDCANDVFVQVFESISAYTGKGPLKSFIGTIAVRTAVKRFRSNVYSGKTEFSIDDEDAPTLPASDDTEGSVQEKEFRKRLWEIVDTLGEPDSRIIVYQYGYELKISEIAELLGMTPAAVQKRSIRARKRIRKILEKEMLI